MNEIMRFSDFNDATPVLIPTVEQPIEMSVNDVLRWIAPTAPPFEAMKFLMACRMAQVNPFLGEAHLVDHGGRFTTIIDKSGYLKRAQAHPAYEGHEAGIIAQEFDPKSGHRGPLVDLEGAFLPHGYIVVGGWARVYRKGVRKPIGLRVSIAEYNRGQGTWKTLTCTMIRKVSLVQALRESGLISSGWYADAEVNLDPGQAGGPGGGGSNPGDATPDDFDDATRGVIDVEYRDAEDSSLDPEMMARLVELVRDAGMTPEQLQSALARRGASRIADLSNVQANELALKLAHQIRYRNPAGAIAELMPGMLIDHGATGEPVEAEKYIEVDGTDFRPDDMVPIVQPAGDGHADAPTNVQETDEPITTNKS